MSAIHLRKSIEKDGELVLTGLPWKKGAEVEVTIETETAEPPRRQMTAADLLNSGLVGMWADRDDIGDSSEFARQLREKAQRRGTRT